MRVSLQRPWRAQVAIASDGASRGARSLQLESPLLSRGVLFSRPQALRHTAPRSSSHRSSVAPLLVHRHREAFVYRSADIMQADWQTVSEGKWQRPEPMPILEGSSLLWALRRSTRKGGHIVKRLLYISDCMPAIIAVWVDRYSHKAGAPKGMKHLNRAAW